MTSGGFGGYCAGSASYDNTSRESGRITSDHIFKRFGAACVGAACRSTAKPAVGLTCFTE